MRKTKIECSPEVRELNEAVETADLITDYHYDWTTGEQLAVVLESQGCPFHAADLRGKLAAVESPVRLFHYRHCPSRSGGKCNCDEHKAKVAATM